MLKKVFVLLMVIALCLSMWACKKNVSEQPESSTNQSENTENTEQTGTTENIQNTESADNTEQSPDQEKKLLTVADWQLDAPHYLSYEEYFSVTRKFGQSDLKSWIKGNRAFTVSRSNDPQKPYCVECPETKERYCIPLSEAQITYKLLGADGRYAYMHNESQFVRVNLASGETETLLDGQKFCKELPDWNEKYFVFLYDNLVLYYVTYENNTLAVNRLYLPTLKQEILYQEQGEFYNIYFYGAGSNNGPVSWDYFHLEFYGFLKNEFANPNSQFKKMPMYGGTEYKDYSEYWEMENGLELILLEPLYVRYVQNTTEISSFLKCTYDPVSGKLERKNGLVNDHYGSSEMRAHYNTEITTAPPPDVILTPWTNFADESPFDLYPKTEPTEKIASCTLVTGVDSYQYLYVKTDGDYRKIMDTPVSVMKDTGSCVVCISADGNEFFAVSYDGTKRVKLYAAKQGKIRTDSYYFDMFDDRYIIYDGDMLVVLDIATAQYRELVRHKNLAYFMPGYNGRGFPETSIYFIVSVGMHNKAYAIDPDGGRFEEVGHVY